MHAVIGCGASGYVLRARDELAGLPVAVKLLRPERATQPALMQLFTRELRVARALNHPHVCRVFDLQASGEDRFLVMELAGSSLWDELRSGATAERALPDRLDDAEAIGSGLGAIHAAGILHRDIKPANVLRLDDGRLVVSDFGLASLAPLGSATRFVGTPLYMAPEVVAGEPATRASDLFSLGLVLHELFFGRRPQWRSSAGRRLMEVPPAARRGREQAVARLCADCLALGPEARPADAPGILRRLRAIRAGGERCRLGQPLRLAGLATAVLLLGGGLAVFTSRALPPAPPVERAAARSLRRVGSRSGTGDLVPVVVSAVPRSPVLSPALPRVHVVGDREELRRIFQALEAEAVAAGVTPAFAGQVTAAVQRKLRVGSNVYPVAMYYFIVREAALRHDSRLAAENLASALSTGLILKLRDLPAKDPRARQSLLSPALEPQSV